jgi:hypothetical protein
MLSNLTELELQTGKPLFQIGSITLDPTICLFLDVSDGTCTPICFDDCTPKSNRKNFAQMSF